LTGEKKKPRIRGGEGPVFEKVFPSWKRRDTNNNKKGWAKPE